MMDLLIQGRELLSFEIDTFERVAAQIGIKSGNSIRFEMLLALFKLMVFARILGIPISRTYPKLGII